MGACGWWERKKGLLQAVSGFFGRRMFVRRRAPFSLDCQPGAAEAPATLKHTPPLFLGSRNGLDRPHGARCACGCQGPLQAAGTGPGEKVKTGLQTYGAPKNPKWPAGFHFSSPTTHAHPCGPKTWPNEPSDPLDIFQPLSLPMLFSTGLARVCALVCLVLVKSSPMHSNIAL